MDHPWILIRDDGSRELITEPIPFIGPGDVQHPASAWHLWTAADWAVQCPGWRALSVIDELPEPAADERIERLPDGQWAEMDGVVRVAYRRIALTPAEIAARDAARLETARADKVAAVNAERERRLSIGAPFSGKRIDVSDKGRADLGGMSVAALLAQAGTVPWSDGYAQGWITQDNSRVSLPDPFDGIALAASVGDWYGRTMQHARDLKDAALAGDPAAVDELAGWP